ncbi:unnamed protein product [Enterobius vermicularis]|uniref:CRIB domain-containing protein n=1 Tax=Enterobius vermicularis TaxID=51028 RepID=A0A0N4VCE9_ENTVE|nr:unnamed protein product [Enterobius vermicularis]
MLLRGIGVLLCFQIIGTECCRSPNDMDHKNEGSSMLSDEQNMNIFGQLGDECYTLVTGIVEVLMEDMKVHAWTKIDMGAICYVIDYNKKKYSLRLIDPGLNNNPPSEKWKIAISPDVEFAKTHPHLITFITPDDAVYGLNFSFQHEAETFFFRVQQLQNERRETVAPKKGILKNFKWFPNSSDEHVTSYTVRHEASNGSVNTVKEKEKTGTTNGRPKSFLFSPITEGMDKAFTSITNFVDTKAKNFMKEKEGKAKRNKHKEIKKFEISQPSEFQHLAHMGDSPFLHIGNSPVYLEDSMTDQTVKEIYAFLGMDFSSASKYYTQVNEDEERSRKFLLLLRSDDLTGDTNRRAANGSADTSDLSPSSFSRINDSMRRPARDFQRQTPANLKRSDEIRKRVLDIKSLFLRKDSKWVVPGNVSSALKKTSPDSCWHIFDSERKESGKSGCSTSRFRNGPKPPVPLKTAVVRATVSPSTTVSSVYGESVIDAQKTASDIAARKTVRSQEYEPSKTRTSAESSSISSRTVTSNISSNSTPEIKVNGTRTGGIRSVTTTADSKITNEVLPKSAIVKEPPPIPPLLSQGPRVGEKVANNSRSDLLAEIRNADRSALRKVNVSPDVRKPRGRLEEESVIDAIALMIERRRQRIASSDEDDDDESTDDEDWE